jgi:hypothetical protein
LLESADLLTETAQFFVLGGGHPVPAGALIEISLLDPVTDGLSGGLKLGGKFIDGATGSGEFDDLPAKLRGIGLTCSWHVDLLFVDKWKIVHQTGLTPRNFLNLLFGRSEGSSRAAPHSK